MLSFRQLLFLATIVFCFGAGLGFSWRSGWLPIEMASVNTGTIADESVEPMEEAEAPAPTDLSGVAEPKDALVASRQPETEEVIEQEESTDNSIKTALRSNSSPQMRESVAAEEPEWAAEPAPRQAPVRQLTHAQPQQPATSRSAEIRLASNQQDLTIRDIPDERATDRPESPFAAELRSIDEQISKNDLLPAHRALSKLYWSHKEARLDLESRLQQTSQSIFFEPKPHFVEPYIVQPNDQLRVIAGKYQLSWEYLAMLNRTNPRRLQTGQKLKILKGPFAAIVDLSDFALTIHLQGYYVKRYQVGIGKDGSSPVGKFAVLNKVENPQYTGPDGKVISADDPSNPLGERWIDLGESYGIHGTTEPDSIGKAASRGCIRMRDKDIIEVYDFLVKGSEVVIRK